MNRVNVAIVGAGPYGLSVAAHLTDAGVDHRIFGSTMATWKREMPDGMVLRSDGFASSLSDRRNELTFESFCEEGVLDLPYPAPVPIEAFRDYSDWFVEKSGVRVEDVMVQNIARSGGGFELDLSTGETVCASKVVMAIGVTHFAHVAPELAHLPDSVCTHPSRHPRLDTFAGRHVTVVGIGQSGLETAALLHEHGADVRVVGRGTTIRWNPSPPPLERPVMERLRTPAAGLSFGWKPWMFEHLPFLYRHLPARKRSEVAFSAFGPAGAWWLCDRVAGKIPVLLGRSIRSAFPTQSGVQLELSGPHGVEVVETDHVVSATGYRADLDVLDFVDPGLRAALRRIGRLPRLGRHLESSVPGLYFVGMTAAPSYGPVCRFVLGTKFAAHTVAGRLTSTTRS